MGMKLSSIAIDSDKSENGIWKEVALGTGFECLIARHTNSRFRAELERRLMDITRESSKEPTAKQYSDATLKAFCSHILLDWRGIEDDDDQPIPYSSEKAYEILSNPEYADLREAIENVSTSEKAYRREANLGNLKGSSGGGLKTESKPTGTSEEETEG